MIDRNPIILNWNQRNRTYDKVHYTTLDILCGVMNNIKLDGFINEIGIFGPIVYHPIDQYTVARVNMLIEENPGDIIYKIWYREHGSTVDDAPMSDDDSSCQYLYKIRSDDSSKHFNGAKWNSFQYNDYVELFTAQQMWDSVTKYLYIVTGIDSEIVVEGLEADALGRTYTKTAEIVPGLIYDPITMAEGTGFMIPCKHWMNLQIINKMYTIQMCINGEIIEIIPNTVFHIIDHLYYLPRVKYLLQSFKQYEVDFHFKFDMRRFPGNRDVRFIEFDIDHTDVNYNFIDLITRELQV